jgi:FecR protein
MRTTFAASLAALLALVLFGAASSAQQTAAPAPAPAEPIPAAVDSTTAPVVGNSKVRIVRLSQVNGAVQMDRNTGHGFETAMQNMPVTEGAKLKTDTGLAEVEFEDSSSLRVTPGTLIEFSQLELEPSGAKLSTIHVLAGTVYASLANTKGNETTLNFGSEKVSLLPASHVRLEMAAGKASLSVFDGNVQVYEAADPKTVGKKQTLTFDLTTPSQPAQTKEVADNDYDAWDHRAVDYQKSYANTSAYGSSPYSYGISDMNYYGSFSDAGGCGSMWRPYFASASWNPYGSGLWAWYPGAGYSWVSPYPWGWTPYHYGSWSFCSGTGWGWMPGGSWMGLSNAPETLQPLSPLRGGARAPSYPVRPLHAPLTGESTLLPINLEKLQMSKLGEKNTFVFQNDSAGLGVPRGDLGKLNRFSIGAAQHGSASVPVSSYPISARTENGTLPGRQGAVETNSRSAESGRSSSGGAGREGMGSGSRGSSSMGAGSMGAGSMGAGSAGHGGSAGGSSSGGHR